MGTVTYGPLADPDSGANSPTWGNDPDALKRVVNHFASGGNPGAYDGAATTDVWSIGDDTSPCLPGVADPTGFTPESMGVPAGATVTGIDLSYDWFVDGSAFPADGVKVTFSVFNGAYTFEIATANPAFYYNYRSWSAQVAYLSGLSIASDEAITLRLNVMSYNDSGIFGWGWDNVSATFTYTGGGGEVGSIHVMLGGGL